MPKREIVERRKYLRLDSVFPVEIYLPTQPGQRPRLVQAFTRDVSLGGLCLSVNDPDQSFLSRLDSAEPIEISIDMPILTKPIHARVKVAWHEIRQLARHRQMLMGVSYDEIADKDRKKIVYAARCMKYLPKLSALAIALLIFLLISSHYQATQLRLKNVELVNRFYGAQQEAEAVGRSAAKIDKEREALTGAIGEKEALEASLKAKLAQLRIEDPQALAKERERLNAAIASAEAERVSIEAKLKEIIDRRERAKALQEDAKGKRRLLDEATTANMVQWLKTHQNKFTGLLMSFEGDRYIRHWAFIYDQSLASQVFLISNDPHASKQILLFFKDVAQKRDGAFLNAYNTITGAPAEETVHVGPNIWLAIAAVHYSKKTGEASYMALAEEIASWAISLKDKEGGIKGGPNADWYSTEHNLDAYALFKMLYAATGKEIYRSQMESTLKWLKDYTYSKKELRMNRGKGDSTIATDTLAWAIAAIGPSTLAKEGMDPDAIVKFAEDECLVSTEYRRPDGDVVNIRGFDFAKPLNVARNGIVSTEWTAQMVIAYRMMSDYYKLSDARRGRDYAEKAEFYLKELDKMVISSPSPSGQGAGCLPYASQPSADTGHGWRTPAGADTGSISGTAYTIFAKRGYNPLELE